MIFSWYEIKNKRRCNELGRKRMRDDFMELNYIKLNYLYFGDEMDSTDASNNLDEDVALYKSLFYFKRFSTIQNSELI